MIRPANALLLSSLFLAAPIAASASPITYAVNEVFPGFSAVGTITTDGTIGDLSASDINSFNLLLTEGSNSARINSGVNIFGNTSLYGTTLALVYDYGAAPISYFLLGVPSTGDTFCIGETNGCVIGVETGVVIEVGGHVASASLTGAVIGTTVSVTPEPSSIILLGSGLVGMIGVARRRCI